MDDGAKTFEESLAMVKMAAEAGTTDIVATPHADLHYRFDAALVAERVVELQAAVGSAIRIHRGCDFHLAFDYIQDALEHRRKYTINQGRYLLVEFSEMAIFHTTTDVFERFLAAGITPVITHPERNSLLRQRMTDLTKWVEMGCLMQVTGAAFLGNFGERARAFSETLMEKGMVHVVASDGHDLEHRPPVLDEVREHLRSKYSEAIAERLTRSNPRAIIESVPLPQPDEGSGPWAVDGETDDGAVKKWFQFWR